MKSDFIMTIQTEIHHITPPGGQKLAYCRSEGAALLPTVMFLGGFRSDMQGTKAQYLEGACRARGQSFIRFDYSGHGQSGGDFEDGTISRWRDDAAFILNSLTKGPVILVGSSMGGWIALLLLRTYPDRVAGLVGLAAAPDFTKGLYEQELTEAQRKILHRQGYIDLSNDYSDEPYRFTLELIEDGAQNSILGTDFSCTCPIRLIQGMKDNDVAWQTAHRIKNTLKGADTVVFLVEDGDHRLSRPADLALIDAQVRLLSGLEPS